MDQERSMIESRHANKIDRHLSSPIFTFYVGPNKAAFPLHISLVAEHSASLATVINGKMREGQEKCAYLDNVGEDTFRRAADYLYTGFYREAEVEVMFDTSPIGQQDVQENHGSGTEGRPVAALMAEPTPDPNLSGRDTSHIRFANSLPIVGRLVRQLRRRKRGRKLDPPLAPIPSRQEQLWSKFRDLRLSSPNENFTPQTNKEPSESFSRIFLCHAELYQFAEANFIEPLRKLSLLNLQKTLVAFTLYEKRICDIVALITCIYENTDGNDTGEYSLRDLITHYTACKIEILDKDAAFRELLAEYEEFSADLVQKMIERLD